MYYKLNRWRNGIMDPREIKKNAKRNKSFIVHIGIIVFKKLH